MDEKGRQEARDRVKARLSQYIHIKGEKAQIEQILADLEGARTAPSTSKWDSMPRGGGNGDPMTGGLIRKEQLIERYHRKDAELTEALNRIETMLEALTPKERELMRHRYIEGMKWEVVCVKVGYEWSQTHRIHNGALDKLIDAERVGGKEVV